MLSVESIARDVIAAKITVRHADHVRLGQLFDPGDLRDGIIPVLKSEGGMSFA